MLPPMLCLAVALPPGLEVKSAGGMAVNTVTIGKKVSVYRGSAPILLQTHARRDVVGVSKAGKLIVPAAEEKFFTNPGAWWDLYWETRFHDYDARHSL